MTRAHVIRGNALNLPLPDETVDLVVTSPPYFGLRSYQDGGEHYAGQIGSEPTPAEFVDALLAATREMMRVLKPTGSLWLNLGDKYSTGNSGQSGMAALGEQYRGGGHADVAAKQRVAPTKGFPPKTLLGIPWRYALRCIDDLGLILRRDQIWDKPNHLPESQNDRCVSAHEYWFHLVKQPRYYTAVDEIREPHLTPALADTRRRNGRGGTWAQGTNEGMAGHPLGKLPGSVWRIPTQPLIVPDHVAHARCCNGRKRNGCQDGLDHYAAFPMEWPRRIIRGWSPPGICLECGDGRRPVSLSTITGDRGGRQFNPSSGNIGVLGKEREYRITGYACACPEPAAPTRPAIVLDPFMGTGTVPLVASVLGRTGIGIDLSADYCRLAQWRTTDPGERARALEVPKPPPVPDDQMDLFGEATA